MSTVEIVEQSTKLITETIPLTLIYTGEPIEKCNSSSCMYHEYLMFRNTLVKNLYTAMIETFNGIIRFDIKKHNISVKIDWFSSKFNDDLFEYDLDKIKDSVRDVFQVSGVIGRKDKLFNNDFIEINKHFHEKEEDFFIVNVSYNIS
jgi:hypothetical protein